MTTNSGVMLSLFKDFRLSFYLILVYKFCIVGFLGVRLTCPVGFGHVPSHLVLGCDKNGIGAQVRRSHMYKPSLSRVSRIGTETSVLIFERL